MNFINSLSRFQKISLVVLIDIVTSLFSTWIAFSVRLDTFHIPNNIEISLYIISILIYLPCFLYFGLYNSIFRYTGIKTLLILFKASLFYAFTFFVVIFLLKFFSNYMQFFNLYGVPRSIGIMQPLIFLFFVSFFRICGALILQSNSQIYEKKKFIIYGAGSAGVQFESASFELDIFCFIDDNHLKIGKEINGKKILNAKNIEKIIKDNLITDILVAIPSMGFNQRRILIAKFKNLEINIRFLPSLANIVSGNIVESDFRSIKIEDLIERKINFENDDQDFFSNKKILISGAGGSIGQEICLQLIKMNFKEIILLDNSEYNLYKITNTLEKYLPIDNNKKITSRLGSIRDYDRLDHIFSEFKPNIVYHCAAYKHVPIIEQNIIESVTNNIFGTKNIVDLSTKYKIKNFILISTDKAVRPTNIMGVSKRVSELYIQAKNEISSETAFSIVRFGNVLYSSGSVAPLFTEQISKGGPVTVTHKDITRYFMTIPEAARLVLQSSSISKGGEVYVLDMGKPIKLIDMAKKMIRLSGRSIKDSNNMNGDIEIKIIGLRPGEKLHEELLISADAEKTQKKYIFKAHEKYIKMNKLLKYFDELSFQLKENNIQKIIQILKTITPEFKHKKDN